MAAETAGTAGAQEEDAEAGEGEEAPTALLYLIVGNTRLHWAWVGPCSSSSEGCQYVHWNSEHSTVADDGEGVDKVHGIPTSFLPASVLPRLSPHPRCFRLLLAGGVVPTHNALWLARSPYAETITTDDTLPPNGGAYPGLGVDRALALRGAGEECGWPCMVVDVGTALTFTLGDAKGRCAGGAICPGLRLALQSLADRTALLPEVSLPTSVDEGLPPMFAAETGAAIQAGVLHGALATVRAYVDAFLAEGWVQEEEEDGGQHRCRCSVVFTGGDAPLLFAALLQQQEPQQQGAGQQAAAAPPRFRLRDDLAFRGLHSLARDKGWLPPGVPSQLPSAVAVVTGGAEGGRAAVPVATHLKGASCEHGGQR